MKTTLFLIFAFATLGKIFIISHEKFPFQFDDFFLHKSGIRINKDKLYLFFLVYATKHENIKCWTCGNHQEGPEEMGWCKDQNEQGNLTTCVATEQSCAVGLISK